MTTPAPMPAARLAEIDALAAAATEGPWEITYDHDDRPDTGLSVKFPTAIGPFTWIEHPTPREDADSAFVAAARTAVPALVAEVRRLQADWAALGPYVGELLAKLTIEGDELRAELAARSTAPLAAAHPHVAGRCPACGRASLFLGDGGYVTCAQADCPEPDAASARLAAKEA